MDSTLAIREAGAAPVQPTEVVVEKKGPSAEVAAHLETHGGMGSDRVKSIVFGGLE